MADLEHFRIFATRKTIRVYRTKTVSRSKEEEPRFPIKEAKEKAEAIKLDKGVSEMFLHKGRPILADDDDKEDERQLEEDLFGPTIEQEDRAKEIDAKYEGGIEEEATGLLDRLEQNPEPRLKLPAPPKEFMHFLRLGGWFRRFPRVEEGGCSKPNRGSKRPKDIHPVSWAGAGNAAQLREIECREAEKRGEGPPKVPEEILRQLPDECRAQIVEAMTRASELVELAAAAVKEEKKKGVEQKPTMALAAHFAAWPEGEKQRERLRSGAKRKVSLRRAKIIEDIVVKMKNTRLALD